MRKKVNFIKLIQAWIIICLVGVAVSIIAIDVFVSYRDFNFRTDQMRSDYIDHQKQMIKQEVDRVVDMIRYEKARSESLTREKIKSRVYEAYSITQNIYQQNKTSKSEAIIQQMILDALRPIRFENGNGYYFAARLDGGEVFFTDRPQVEGLNLLNMQDRFGKYVIKDMIEIAKLYGEGFYEYQWVKPESEGNYQKKISFIKRFKPYDWFIGTSLYVDDVESQIKADLLSAISRIQFGKEGYIFVNKLNGDALVSNGKLFDGTKKLWEVFNDNPEKMKDIFEKEYNAALKPEGDYIYYSHIKLTNPNEESPKVSFIYGIPDLKWLVGAGVYLDDVEANIALMQTKSFNQLKAKMLNSILIVMVIIGLFFLFFTWLSRRLKNDFNLFISFFDRAANSNEGINRENIKFIELDQMAEFANKMLTDRKQAEESARQTKTRHRTVIDTIPDLIWLKDLNGVYLSCNPTFEKFFGAKESEITGKTDYDFVDKDLADFFHEHDRKAMETDRSCINEEWLTFADNGYHGLFETIKTPMCDADGNLVGVLGISRDITKRKKAEKEKVILERKLLQSQKLESVGTLAGGIAHDFNNILSCIIGFTELALDDVEKGTPLEDNLYEVYTAGNRAKELVKQILAFARQSDEEFKPIHPSTIVKEVLKLIRPSIPTSIEIRQNIESDSLIMGNTTQIHQVLMNLCTNAAYAMETEGGILDISLKDVMTDGIAETEKPGNYIEITVSDTGAGIAPDILDKIFEPYFTTKGPGEGTGMGLAMVHGIIESYSGKITVDSKPGQGTRFMIWLPVIRERQKHSQYETETLSTGKERILFVDDEAPIARMGSQLLERLGYSVTTRTSSVEALELFHSKPKDFDLVITDMTMPNLTGDKLAAALIEIRPDIPIILCTGYSRQLSAERAADVGIKALAMKPLARNILAETVRKVLDEAKSSTQR